MTTDTVIRNLEKTVRAVSTKIRDEKEINPSHISSLAKLVTAMTALSSTMPNYEEDGNPHYVEQIEAMHRRNALKRAGVNLSKKSLSPKNLF